MSLDASQTRLIPVAPSALPVAEMVIGKPVEVVAALLPRLFNLCRAAQSAAVRLALGLEMEKGGSARLSQDIARDHMLRLCLMLPVKAGLAPVPLEKAVTGFAADLPQTPQDFAAFLTGTHPLAPLFSHVATAFEAGEAACEVLPLVTDETALCLMPCENSVAARVGDHPVMRRLEETLGRGPLWRLFALWLDMVAALEGRLPAPGLTSEGVAIVPAARGLYAVRAEVSEGLVTAFDRVTPTDHLLASGGVMDQSFARLRCENQTNAALLMDILDPCCPVTLAEGV